MGTLPRFSLPSTGSNPISNACSSTREISDNNREHKTQNNSRRRFQDYLSAARLVYFIEISLGTPSQREPITVLSWLDVRTQLGR